MENLLIISSILLWILMLLNILLTIGLSRRIRRQRLGLEFMKPGQPAPAFTAWTLDGKEVTQADYAGRAVAFIFVSQHCEPCGDVINKLGALRPRAEQNRVELVLVSDSSEEETREFIEELRTQLPVLVAPRERTHLLRDYKAVATPSYCLVDVEGKVLAAGLDVSALGDKMESLPR